MIRPRFVVLAVAALTSTLAFGAVSADASTYGATTPVLASFGAADPFTSCNNADNATGQEAAFGSVLFPGAEPEPQASVNPTNPLNIAGAYHEARWSDGGDRGLGSSWTTDGGATWHQTVVPGITKCSGGKFDRASDPWVSFGPTGTLWGIWLVFGFFNGDNAILVSKSTDGGATWQATPTVVNEDNTGGDDKQSITADPFHPNNVYAVWDRFLSPPSLHASDVGRFEARSYEQQAFFSRTTDGGAHWSTPSILYNPGTHAGTIGSIITVLPDDTLVDGLVVFADHKAKLQGQEIAIVRSFDQGQTWEKKATIVSPIDPSFRGAFDADHPDKLIRSGDLPAFAVNPTTGALYAAWDDDLPDGTAKIFFSQSTDGGSTWSTPIKINQTPTNIPAGDQQAFTAEVAVAADGTVGVTYYDFRNNTSAAGLTTDYWLVHCHSACASASSWAGNETHVGGPFDMEQAAFARGYFLGDYEGLVPIGNSFGAFFDMAVNRSTNPSDVFWSLASPTP